MLVLAMEFSRGDRASQLDANSKWPAFAGIACRERCSRKTEQRGPAHRASVQETKVFHRKGRSRNRIASDQLGVLGCNDPSRNSLERR